VLMLNPEMQVIAASRGFYNFFNLNQEETEGRRIFELAQRGWDASSIRKVLYETLPAQKEVVGYKLTDTRPDGGKRQILMNARLIETQAGEPRVALLTFQDITAEPEGSKRK